MTPSRHRRGADGSKSRSAVAGSCSTRAVLSFRLEAQEGRTAARLESEGIARRGHRRAALNVSQLSTFPDFSPFMNQRVRCADEPWVKASGTT